MGLYCFTKHILVYTQRQQQQRRKLKKNEILSMDGQESAEQPSTLTIFK